MCITAKDRRDVIQPRSLALLLNLSDVSLIRKFDETLNFMEDTVKRVLVLSRILHAHPITNIRPPPPVPCTNNTSSIVNASFLIKVKTKQRKLTLIQI